MTYYSMAVRVGLIGAFSLCLLKVPSETALIRLKPPTVGQWVMDRAAVLPQEEERAIAARCEEAFVDTGVPIIVVAINTMSLYAREGTPIEVLARNTFEAWGRNNDFHYRASWRKGMLLFVSMKDRKARIELGADWAGTADEQCEQIMQGFILPKFRAGEYPAGVASGVDGLIHLAKGEGYALTGRQILRGIWYGLIVTPESIMTLMVVIGFIFFPNWFTPKTKRSSAGRGSWDDYDSDSGGGGGDSSYGGGGGATGSW